MSQLARHLLIGSNLEKVAVDDLSLVTPVNNQIFALGGSNVNTEGSGDTVTVNLDDDITITSAQIDNINIAVNTISSTNINGDILLLPNGSGAINVPYVDSNSGALTDTIPEIESTSSMTDGQVVIGRTGNQPVARTLTAGDNITITNSAHNITIAAEGGSGEGGGGGLLSWQRLDYTGSETRNYNMEPNKGYITNSNQANLANPNYCPKINLNLKVPSTGSVEIGDMFWVVNKGVGSVAIRGDTDQTFMYTYLRSGSGSSALFDTSYHNWSSTFYLTPAQDNTQSTGPVKYVYLSSILLLYVGEVVQLANSSSITYSRVFHVLNTVGNWTPRPKQSGCFST